MQPGKEPFWKLAVESKLRGQPSGETLLEILLLSTLPNAAGRSSPKEGLQEHLQKGHRNNPGK